MMTGEAPVHLKPTERFGNRADDYALSRPSYPAGAIDVIIGGLAESCGVPQNRLVIADVGAGTGISSRLLAERGVRVIAVEPNAAMREAGRNDSRTNIEWRDGTAEATGLADASVHGVVCAQAFHWFRPAEALAEFVRVLVPRGRVALMWNNRDERDAFTNAYERAIVKAAEASGLAVPYLDSSKPLHESRLFVDGRVMEFDYAQKHDRAGLIQRAASVSYAPRQGEAHERLIRDLNEAFDRFADADGTVTMRYVTRVHLADKPA